jgi:hypothetical protein
LPKGDFWAQKTTSKAAELKTSGNTMKFTNKTKPNKHSEV